MKNLPVTMRDMNPQPGTDRVVLAVGTGSHTVWQQGEAKMSQGVNKVRTVPGQGKQKGVAVSPVPHAGLPVKPRAWHILESADEVGIWLMGYTPRGLHKLSNDQKKCLWQSSFNHVPDTKYDFWTWQHQSALLVRHHHAPRRTVFTPAADMQWPVPVDWLGNVCLQERRTASGASKSGLIWWKAEPAALPSVKWRGKTTFHVLPPDAACVQPEGGSSAKSSFEYWSLLSTPAPRHKQVCKVQPRRVRKVQQPRRCIQAVRCKQVCKVQQVRKVQQPCRCIQTIRCKQVRKVQQPCRCIQAMRCRQVCKV